MEMKISYTETRQKFVARRLTCVCKKKKKTEKIIFCFGRVCMQKGKSIFLSCQTCVTVS